MSLTYDPEKCQYSIDGKPVTFEFDAEKHEYTVDGQPVPSVTQIIKKAGLTSQFYQKKGRDRGSRVHDVLADAEIFGCDWFEWIDPDAYADPEIRPYIDAYRSFRKVTWFDPVLIEEKVLAECAGVLYAGTFDRLGKYGEGLFLLDLKTGKREAWHATQLYAYSLSPSISPHSPELADLYLTKKGTYQWFRVSPGERSNARVLWHHALKALE